MLASIYEMRYCPFLFYSSTDLKLIALLPRIHSSDCPACFYSLFSDIAGALVWDVLMDLYTLLLPTRF